MMRTMKVEQNGNNNDSDKGDKAIKMIM
jgi:hypothetical protein